MKHVYEGNILNNANQHIKASVMKTKKKSHKVKKTKEETLLLHKQYCTEMKKKLFMDEKLMS